MFDPKPHAHLVTAQDSGIDALTAGVTCADAIVIATPVYHNSYSGLVKNALDLLGAEQMHWKPVGLVSNSGGRHTTQAVDHLGMVIRGLSGIPIPSQLVTTDDDYDFRRGVLVLVNPDVSMRARRFVSEVVWFATGLAESLGKALVD
jgi:NAD(P)H-dependent FMN reductase